MILLSELLLFPIELRIAIFGRAGVKVPLKIHSEKKMNRVVTTPTLRTLQSRIDVFGEKNYEMSEFSPN